MVNKNFESQTEVNEIMRKLFEARIFIKWMRDSQRKIMHEVEYVAALKMQIIHIGFLLIFINFIGPIICIATFIAEQIIWSKMK